MITCIFCDVVWVISESAPVVDHRAVGPVKFIVGKDILKVGVPVNKAKIEPNNHPRLAKKPSEPPNVLAALASETTAAAAFRINCACDAEFRSRSHKDISGTIIVSGSVRFVILTKLVNPFNRTGLALSYMSELRVGVCS